MTLLATAVTVAILGIMAIAAKHAMEKRKPIRATVEVRSSHKRKR